MRAAVALDSWGPGRAGPDALALCLGVLAGAWLAPLLPAPAVGPGIAAVGAAGLAWAWASHCRQGRSLGAIGLRVDDWHRSGPVFLAAAAVPIATLVAGGAIDPASPGRLAEPRALAGYFVWALFQQVLAVALVWRHLVRWLGLPDRRARVLSAANLKLSALTATAFALVHAPNAGLMVLVWVGEAVWIALFARFRNLFALAAAHALSALAVAEALQPSWLLPNARVGLGYLMSH